MILTETDRRRFLGAASAVVAGASSLPIGVLSDLGSAAVSQSAPLSELLKLFSRSVRSQFSLHCLLRDVVPNEELTPVVNEIRESFPTTIAKFCERMDGQLRRMGATHDLLLQNDKIEKWLDDQITFIREKSEGLPPYSGRNCNDKGKKAHLDHESALLHWGSFSFAEKLHNFHSIFNVFFSRITAEKSRRPTNVPNFIKFMWDIYNDRQFNPDRHKNSPDPIIEDLAEATGVSDTSMDGPNEGLFEVIAMPRQSHRFCIINPTNQGNYDYCVIDLFSPKIAGTDRIPYARNQIVRSLFSLSEKILHTLHERVINEVDVIQRKSLLDSIEETRNAVFQVIHTAEGVEIDYLTKIQRIIAEGYGIAAERWWAEQGSR